MQVVESAKVILPDRAGRVLVVRRTLKDVNGGEWDLLGGGMEPGESPEDTGRRETGEEADVWLPCSAFLLVHTSEGQSRSRQGIITRYHYLIGNLAVGDRKLTVLQPNPAIHLSPEHDDYRWESPGRAQELLSHPRAREVLGHFVVNGILRSAEQSAA